MTIRIPKSVARRLGIADPSKGPRVVREGKDARRGAIADAGRVDLSAVFPDESGLAWARRFWVPFDQAVSKNAAWRVGNGHVYKSSAGSKARRRIASEARAALRGVAIANAKLWIDVIVQKPSTRGDAINVLDVLADAIQDATGLNDRWYSVRRIDWQVVGTSPRILIGLAQETGPENSTCGICGRVLPVKMFRKDKRARLGVASACKECRKRIDEKGT